MQNTHLVTQKIHIKLSAKYLAAAAAKSRQSCPTLCDPIDGSPTGSSVPGKEYMKKTCLLTAYGYML